MKAAYRIPGEKPPEPPKRYRRRLTDHGRRLLWLPTSTMGYGLSQLFLALAAPEKWVIHLILGSILTVPWLFLFAYIWWRQTYLEEVMSYRSPP